MSKVIVSFLGVKVDHEQYQIIQDKGKENFDFIQKADSDFSGIAGQIMNVHPVDESINSIKGTFIIDCESPEINIRIFWKEIFDTFPDVQLYSVICDSTDIYYSKYTRPF